MDKIRSSPVSKKRDTERAAPVGAPADDKGKCQMSFSDKDNDKKLSEDEMTSILNDIQKDKKMFAKYDEDGNGFVDASEFSFKVAMEIRKCQK
uniref:Calconectin n=1 Tax=Margaritifera margaritifera TaxID=102329 RepID=Q1KZ60_PINMG|nr:calconectin [Pinctada margaritifera]